MKEDINETIDCYLTGDMTSEEQAAFEDEISSDEQLAIEVKLHRDIIRGIKREGLRELLKAEEHKRRSAERMRRAFKVVLAPVISIAACVMLFVHFDNRSSCIDMAPTLSIQAIRGSNDLNDIVAMIEVKEYSTALSKIEELRESLPKEFSEGEEGDYQRQITQSTLDKLDWFNVTIAMKRGRWVQAKRQLRSIANGRGEFAAEAQSILDKL